MGAMDKFLNLMKLAPNTGDDEYFFDEEDVEEEEEEEVKKPATTVAPLKPVSTSEPRKTPERRETTRTTSSRSTSASRSAAPARTTADPAKFEICSISPKSFEDAREIVETLLLGKTVLLNLQGIDMNVAQRIIDFTSGSCFAIDGNLQMTSDFSFLITPSNVDISGDFQDRLSGGHVDVPKFN